MSLRITNVPSFDDLLFGSLKYMTVALSWSVDSADSSSVVAVSLRSWLLLDFADKQISPAYELNWTEYDINLVVDFR